MNIPAKLLMLLVPGLSRYLWVSDVPGKVIILRQVAKQLIDNGVKPENTLFINREFTDFDFLKTYKDLDELIKLYKNELGA